MVDKISYILCEISYKIYKISHILKYKISYKIQFMRYLIKIMIYLINYIRYLIKYSI